MEKIEIQSVGTIIKKEKLASIEEKNECKILLLELVVPFPGYHGSTVPELLEPESIFAVTKNIYSDERIIRTTQSIKQKSELNFDAVPGTIMLKNKPVNVVRFKKTSYNQISEIISYYMDSGIEFEKAKKVEEYDSMIEVRKFFRLNEIEDGNFEDMDVKEFFYVQVPKHIEWDKFEEITKNIRYNIADANFDAAQTSVYEASGLLDFVRIYDKNRNIENLNTIKRSYLNII